MFVVVRSVFWLTLAYMVIKPAVDLPDASALQAQALAAGTQVVAEQVGNIECDTIQCIGGKAVIAAALQSSPSAGLPMHEMPATSPVPYPRPRLDRAG
jgi:hypothetical protein